MKKQKQKGVKKQGSAKKDEEGSATSTSKDATTTVESSSQDAKAKEETGAEEDGAEATVTESNEGSALTTTDRAKADGSTVAPPQSPSGSAGTVQDIYRKQVQRIEELERDNKRLQAEALDKEERWKKSEEELEVKREESGEVVDLRTKASEVDALVSIRFIL